MHRYPLMDKWFFFPWGRGAKGKNQVFTHTELNVVVETEQLILTDELQVQILNSILSWSSVNDLEQITLSRLL